MKADEPRQNRIPFMMSDAELKAVDDWRFANRIATRAEAVRRLIQLGLFASDAPQPSGTVEDLLDEGLEILNALIDNIKRCGNYSPDATCTFIDQAGQCLREALSALTAGKPEPASGTDYFGSLVERARASATKASAKFPQPNYVTLKIAEEAGEVIRGAVHYAERRMEWSEVEGEIIQLLAMLIRFVTEGDQVNGIVPPTPPTAGGGDE